MMKPVKVRYMGIWPMTRRQYLRTVIWGWVALILLLMLFTMLRPNRAPAFHWPWDSKSPRLRTLFQTLYGHYFYTILFACIIAQIVDAVIMMRKFREKEAEEARRAMQDTIDD